MEPETTHERDELHSRLEALEARNEELRRLLAEAYGRIEELEPHPRRSAGTRRAQSPARAFVGAKAPWLARLYRDLRVRLG